MATGQSAQRGLGGVFGVAELVSGAESGAGRNRSGWAMPENAGVVGRGKQHRSHRIRPRRCKAMDDESTAGSFDSVGTNFRADLQKKRPMAVTRPGS